MDEGLLRELASEFLVPFFSGASLDSGARPSSRQDSLVAFLDPISLAFKIGAGDSYRLVLHRSQPFATISTVVVPEIDVVRAFVDVLGAMEQHLGTDFQRDILSTFRRRVVARSVAPDSDWEPSLLEGIDQLQRWATRLYEGAPISASIGFRHKPQPPRSPTLTQISGHDFSALLSNGHDTLLEFDVRGRFINHVSLPPSEDGEEYCPVRQTPIAKWTLGDKHRRRVALILNRLGEILVIRDGQLLFARRSGQWSFLTHKPVLTQMGTPNDMGVRRAIYQTCLDASFARTGACIGAVSSSYGGRWRGLAVHEDDHITLRKSAKARAVAKILHGAKFQELDRRLRQELVAVDGATIISHKGELLTVGAILRIPGGSTGGGRLAAAKALSGLGVGIKVSQDGGIIGFRNGAEAFRIM